MSQEKYRIPKEYFTERCNSSKVLEPYVKIERKDNECREARDILKKFDLDQLGVILMKKF